MAADRHSTANVSAGALLAPQAIASQQVAFLSIVFLP